MLKSHSFIFTDSADYLPASSQAGTGRRFKFLCVFSHMITKCGFLADNQDYSPIYRIESTSSTRFYQNQKKIGSQERENTNRLKQEQK